MPLLRRHLLIAAAASLPAAAWAQTAVNGANVARSLAELVDLEYPDAQAAHALAMTLRANARRGAYRGLSPTALAERLTRDMRASIRDEHLNVSYEPDEADTRSTIQRGPPTPPHPTPATPSVRAREIFAPQNYGIKSVRVSADNIGILEVDNFPPLYDVTRERYGAAMTFLTDTRALLIDLRANGGGDGSSSAYLTSYFFDRESFLLARMIWRRLPPEDSYTMRNLAGPNYGEQRPVFVITSSETFSAAEGVAYDLQSFGRAKVVGENTRGGANPGDFFNIGQGFVAFVPQGHAQNVHTGGNWEGQGVRPDIAANAPDALDAAHRAAIEALR